jgi:hypothetical protein
MPLPPPETNTDLPARLGWLEGFADWGNVIE